MNRKEFDKRLADHDEIQELLIDAVRSLLPPEPKQNICTCERCGDYSEARGES